MRNTWIDFLKGIAIIAIVLFHADRLQFGYLGVDIFFVISGFFVTKGLLRNMENGSYGYRNYFMKILILFVVKTIGRNIGMNTMIYVSA